MRGAVLPVALICVAWALMLAFAPRRALLVATLLLVLSAGTASQIHVAGHTVEIAFLGLWATLILLAMCVHLPRGVPPVLACIGSVIAGLFVGLIVAAEGRMTDLGITLAGILIVLPARWIIGRGWQIALKVVSSWLIAVAILAALLPTTATPGYVKDHMD